MPLTELKTYREVEVTTQLKTTISEEDLKKVLSEPYEVEHLGHRYLAYGPVILMLWNSSLIRDADIYRVERTKVRRLSGAKQYPRGAVESPPWPGPQPLPTLTGAVVPAAASKSIYHSLHEKMLESLRKTPLILSGPNAGDPIYYGFTNDFDVEQTQDHDGTVTTTARMK